MNIKISIHNRSLETRKKSVDNWNVPNVVKKVLLSKSIVLIDIPF